MSDVIPKSGYIGNAQFAFINPAVGGDTQIVAAATGRRIRVVSLLVVTTLANSVHLRSSATPILATLPLAANGGVALPLNEYGYCETAVGEALSVNMTVATATGVQVVYCLVG